MQNYWLHNGKQNPQFNPDSALEKNRYFHCQISNA
jgi:hypothetical protein